jgi:hypothetical protein
MPIRMKKWLVSFDVDSDEKVVGDVVVSFDADSNEKVMVMWWCLLILTRP